MPAQGGEADGNGCAKGGNGKAVRAGNESSGGCHRNGRKLRSGKKMVPGGELDGKTEKRRGRRDKKAKKNDPNGSENFLLYSKTFMFISRGSWPPSFFIL